MKRPSHDERSTSVLNIVADVGVDIEKYGLVLSVEIYIKRRLTQNTNMEKEKQSNECSGKKNRPISGIHPHSLMNEF